MPGMPYSDVRDALTLPDGRIVAFVWHGTEGTNSIWTLDPGADGWQRVELDAFLGSDVHAALGGDGRIYTHELVIDPRSPAWAAEPIELVPEGGPGNSMTGGLDGRIYRWALDGSGQLSIYDPATHEFSRSSTLPKYSTVDFVHAAPDGIYAVGGDNNNQEALAWYDPEADAWTIESETLPGDYMFFAWDWAGADDQRRLYVESSHGGPLMAWEPKRRQWLTVELPASDVKWRGAVFIAAPEGSLYAIDGDAPFVFTPDE